MSVFDPLRSRRPLGSFLPGARMLPPPKKSDPPNVDRVLLPPPRALAARGTPRSYRKGTLIIEEGTQGDTLYLLLAGQVKAFSSDVRGREVVYGVYGPGDYFGEMSLDGGPRSASVMEESACTCAVLTRQTLREHIKAEPEFAFELLARVIRRARLATQGARSMALLDVYGRSVQFLNSQAQPSTDGSRFLSGRLSQADIAARLGCSREMSSRLMGNLRTGGFLEVVSSGVRLPRDLPRHW